MIEVITLVIITIFINMSLLIYILEVYFFKIMKKYKLKKLGLRIIKEVLDNYQKKYYLKLLHDNYIIINVHIGEETFHFTIDKTDVELNWVEKNLVVYFKIPEIIHEELLLKML
jgi:hypothetical protein